MRKSLKSREPRTGKVRIGYELDAELMRQLRILAAEMDAKNTTLLEEAIREFLQKHGKPVPPRAARR